ARSCRDRWPYLLLPLCDTRPQGAQNCAPWDSRANAARAFRSRWCTPQGLSLCGNWCNIVFGRGRCQSVNGSARLSFVVVVFRLIPLHPPTGPKQDPAMMRAMRENSKWIFYILAVAFIGWLVFDVGMGVTGAKTGGDVVLKVDGTEIHYQQYQQALQAAQE